jgi:hypothetical protein
MGKAQFRYGQNFLHYTIKKEALMVSENKRRSNDVFLNLNSKLLRAELRSYYHNELVVVNKLLGQVNTKMFEVNPAFYMVGVIEKFSNLSKEVIEDHCMSLPNISYNENQLNE